MHSSNIEYDGYDFQRNWQIRKRNFAVGTSPNSQLIEVCRNSFKLFKYQYEEFVYFILKILYILKLLKQNQNNISNVK